MATKLTDHMRALLAIEARDDGAASERLRVHVAHCAAERIREVEQLRVHIARLLLAYDQECSAHGAAQAAMGASQRELLAAVRIFAKM